VKYPIVIGSHPGSRFLQNCLDSIRGLECLVVVNDGYEMGKIKWVYDHTDWNEFVFFQDSVQIKNGTFIPTLFNELEGRSVSLCGCPCPFGSYLGKYRREVLDQMELTETRTKVEAVNMERSFSDAYCAIEKPVQYFEDLNDAPNFEVFGGRQNMVLENFFIKKFKGTWNMGMAENVDN